MELIINKHKSLVNKVKTIVKHHRELTKAKGESFNIYNIMNLQTKEVRTHSAFIGTLLNPKGSHLMGTQFLDAFINVLPTKYFNNHIDITTAKAFIEFHIGIINDKLNTGGRIDILIKDNNGHTISIENKIDAEDGNNQIKRYCNYNKAKNKVIYLSKYIGDEPSTESKGELEAGKHFFNISYQNEMINWLEKCQNIASDQPILRESIKQYKILIQQITHTLSNKEEKELKAVIINNLEEASLIASKYSQIIKKIKTNFKDCVFNILIEKTKDYTITQKRSISSKYSSIWFSSKKLNAKKVWFGVESFSGSGHKDGLLFVGIFDEKGVLKSHQNFVSVTKSWIHHKPLTVNDSEIRLSNTTFLNTIKTKEKLEEVSKDIAQQIISFIDEYKSIVED